MIKFKGIRKTSFKVNASKEGESLETKIERIINNKEPIKDGAPILYTPRKEGVLASTNIRTDRFEIAAEAMSGVSKSYAARREERGKPKKKDGEPEPLQGKPETGTEPKKA